MPDEQELSPQEQAAKVAADAEAQAKALSEWNTYKTAQLSLASTKAATGVE
jgi:hypothetical protein